MNYDLSPKTYLSLALLGAFVFWAPNARADALFSLTDGTNKIHFALPNPIKLEQTGVCATDTDLACAFGVPINVNGVSSLATYIAFYDATDLGGLTIFSGSQYLQSQSGSVLFTGSLTAPLFKLGMVRLSNYADFSSTYKGDFSVDVRPVSAVPEPSSLMHLVFWLPLAAFMSRRRIS